MPRKRKKKNKKKIDFLSQDLSIGNKYYFEAIESIYMILDSGQDILTAVEASQEDTDDRRLKALLGKIKSDLKKGAQFWKAMQKHNLIPMRFTQVLKVGEESGILHETMLIIIEQNKHERELKSKVMAAAAYPIVVLGLTIVIGLGVIWFVLPQLSQIYSSFGNELPPVTQFLIWIGDFIRDHGFWFLPTLVVMAILSVIFYFRSPHVQKFVEKVILKTPAIRLLFLESEMSRLGFIFGSLLDVGITVDRALQSLVDATPMFIYRKLYQDMYGYITMGASFGIFFKEVNPPKTLVAPSVKHLILAGEKSGNLPKVLLDIGAMYKVRMERTSDQLAKLLEPLLLVLMFSFVAVLAIGIIMPIYGQLGNLDF